MGQVPTFETIRCGGGWRLAPIVIMWCSLYGIVEKHFGNENSKFGWEGYGDPEISDLGKWMVGDAR